MPVEQQRAGGLDVIIVNEFLSGGVMHGDPNASLLRESLRGAGSENVQEDQMSEKATVHLRRSSQTPPRGRAAVSSRCLFRSPEQTRGPRGAHEASFRAGGSACSRTSGWRTGEHRRGTGTPPEETTQRVDPKTVTHRSLQAEREARRRKRWLDLMRLNLEAPGDGLVSVSDFRKSHDRSAPRR